MTEATEKDLKDLGAPGGASPNEPSRDELSEALRALRQQVEDTIGAAQVDIDADDWVIAYHFKTGAIHRLLGVARDPAVNAGTVYQSGIATPTAAPSNPSDLTSSLTREREENQRLTRALRAVLAEACFDHADMCCAEWCGRCRDEAAARKNAWALLEGNGTDRSPPKDTE